MEVSSVWEIKGSVSVKFDEIFPAKPDVRGRGPLESL